MSDEFFRHKRNHTGVGHIFSSLVGAIIGGLLVSMFSPAITSQPPALNQPRQEEGTAPRAVRPSVGEKDSFVNIAKKVGPAVVGISNRGAGGFVNPHPDVEQGSGSGVIFDQQGYIITNNHVVEGAAELIVNMPNGKDLKGKLIGRDPKTDLAVVKLDPKEAGDFAVATLGDSDQIAVGEDVVAIGNPLGLEFAGTVTRGILSATNRKLVVGNQQFNLLQTDAAINPGNSGGALINTAGEVIGINSVKIMSNKVEGLNFAIPINDVRPIVESLIKNGKVRRPWLGIMGGTINKDKLPDVKVPVDKGVFVVEAIAGGPAAVAGIKANDVIVGIENVKIEEFDTLLQFLKDKQIADKVKVKINRAGKEQELIVTLGEMPAEKE